MLSKCQNECRVVLKAVFAPGRKTYPVPFGNGLKPAYEVLRHRALTINTAVPK